MRELTAHHDGHGLNESIQVIAADEIGPGGAYHEYQFIVPTPEDAPDYPDRVVGELQFQRGPRNVEGSTPGVVEAAVLAVLIDRLECFQAGPYACVENADALISLKEAMRWIHQRAHNRAARQVLGTYQQ